MQFIKFCPFTYVSNTAFWALSMNCTKGDGSNAVLEQSMCNFIDQWAKIKGWDICDELVPPHSWQLTTKCPDSAADASQRKCQDASDWASKCPWPLPVWSVQILWLLSGLEGFTWCPKSWTRSHAQASKSTFSKAWFLCMQLYLKSLIPALICEA